MRLTDSASGLVEWAVERALTDDGLLRLANRRLLPRAINFGGGPAFSALGWHNLDEAGPCEAAFRFSPDCRVPLPDVSVSTVYSSHTLEHLDAPTVDRVLAEAWRILRSAGRLVIKLPDFDRTLECWRNGDASFFRDELWNFNAVTPTWPTRGIEDTLERRASMIFCGFWNDEYGDHFSGRINSHPGAYHGPAVVDEEELDTLVGDRTPAQISAYLRDSVQQKETSFKFNHQNAWGRAELRSLLDRSGFDVVTSDKNVAAVCCADIPDIRSMFEQSSYTVAVARK
ncbi:MAG TPA: methyltransferase domain-containing protein [Pirellulales bacterium]|nr:methyltransferase domain-containing protein [Pirellulales bacterium]